MMTIAHTPIDAIRTTTGKDGNQGKLAFEFRRPNGEWIRIAGLFEESEKYGRCYARITTEPSAWLSPIHDRILAVLDFEEAEAFLRCETPQFEPYPGTIIAAPCVSPLKQTTPGPQGELF